jgi:hypothetical protein
VLDVMDPADVPFSSGGNSATTVSWTQLTSGASASGSLLVAQGAHSANLTLLGQYTQGGSTSWATASAARSSLDPPIAATVVTDPGPFALVVAYR